MRDIKCKLCDNKNCIHKFQVLNFNNQHRLDFYYLYNQRLYVLEYFKDNTLKIFSKAEDLTINTNYGINSYVLTYEIKNFKFSKNKIKNVNKINNIIENLIFC